MVTFTNIKLTKQLKEQTKENQLKKEKKSAPPLKVCFKEKPHRSEILDPQQLFSCCICQQKFSLE